ncbi:MAG: FGGY-family carbohydrate kinase [Gammaproteobacteria bacterium]
MSLYLGIDFGTSGCRGCVINAGRQILAESRIALPPPQRSGARVEQDPALWWAALRAVLADLGNRVALADIRALCVDGTSATLLLCDDRGAPLGPALMYNDTRAREAARQVAAVAPQDCAAHGAGASLAKLLWLLQTPAARHARHALHQADWVLGRLRGRFGCSDENNALKLGYDPGARRWPAWLAPLSIPATLLPEVMPAGTDSGCIDPAVAAQFGLSAGTRIISGTTDSTAGFIATGAVRGEAVTTLGSTLVLKVCSDTPVFAPEHGIYSHRLGDDWLVGGASNSGGAVLRQYFTDADIARLTRELQPDRLTGLDYYPLPARGERFPVNDPDLEPVLTPRPQAEARFFQGILEGIARIEVLGYRRLAALGAPWPTRVISTGGGAANSAWRTIRSQLLDIPVIAAGHQQAAYGTALLALRGAANPAHI